MVLRGRHGLEVCLVDRNNIVYRGEHSRGDCEQGRMEYAERGMEGGCKKQLDGGARQGPTSPSMLTQYALSDPRRGVLVGMILSSLSIPRARHGGPRDVSRTDGRRCNMGCSATPVARSDGFDLQSVRRLPFGRCRVGLQD